MSLQRLKGRRGAALLALVLALAIVLVVVVSRSKSTPVAPSSTATTPSPAPAAGKGFALIDGAYVSPPYSVTLAGDDIQLNGTVIDGVAGSATPSPAPAAAKDADGVVLLGEAHWPANENLTDQQRADMVAFLQSQPATAQVTVGDADLIVTDKSGASALLPLSRHIPDPTAQHQARQALAAEWSALLGSGGLLMTGPGATVEVAGTTAPAVLDSIAKAFTPGGADLEQRLEQVTGAPPVARALARVGKPPKSLLDRLSAAGGVSLALEDTTVRLAAARPPLPSAADAAAVHTPRSSKAYVFDWFGEGDDAAMRTAALDQGYTLVLFKIGGGRYPEGQNSIENFHSMARNGGAGLLYIATHGQGPTLTFDDATESRHLSRSDVRSHWTDVAGVVFLAACHSFGMEDAFAGGDLIGQPFTSVSCEQATQLAREFWPRLDGTKDDGNKRKTRDAFTAAATTLAYPSSAVAPIPTTTLASPPSPSDTILQVTDALGAVVGQQVFAFHNEPELFDHYKYAAIADVTNVDAARGTITIKYRTGSFTGDVGPLHFFDLGGSVSPRPDGSGLMRPFIFRGAGQTVLAPSVSTPPASVPAAVGVASPETVAFDAPVDTTVASRTAITATGPCQPEMVTGSAHWSGDRSLSFSFKAQQKGAATFRVLAKKVRSADNGTLLDGNTNPRDHNRVGPAGDDYTWTVECGSSGVPQRVSDTDIHSSCSLDPIPNQAGRCSVPWPAVEITTGSTLVITTAPEGLVISNDRCSDPQITITVEGAGVRTGPLSSPATFDFGTVSPGRHKVTMTFDATCRPVPPECANASITRPEGLDCTPAQLRFTSLLMQYLQ